MKSRDITYVALFTALTALGAQISIPIGEVPITLQVLFVLLSGMMLSPKLAFLSQFFYLLLGAIGFPVFAGLKGGMAHLYGPTAGYLWGFPLSALFVSYLFARSEGYGRKLISAMSGVGIIYFLGWLRLGFFLNGDFFSAIKIGVLPFVGIDILKAIIAVGVAEKVLVLLRVKSNRI